MHLIFLAAGWLCVCVLLTLAFSLASSRQFFALAYTHAQILFAPFYVSNRRFVWLSWVVIILVSLFCFTFLKRENLARSQ
jgi:hypothetical protein